MDSGKLNKPRIFEVWFFPKMNNKVAYFFSQVVEQIFSSLFLAISNNFSKCIVQKVYNYKTMRNHQKWSKIVEKNHAALGLSSFSGN